MHVLSAKITKEYTMVEQNSETVKYLVKKFIFQYGDIILEVIMWIQWNATIKSQKMTQ